MYITISAQKTNAGFPKSSGSFVKYLEKENEGLQPDEMEYFFDQSQDRIQPEQVIQEIDHNTAKLKQKEPKFYSITLNPSERELKAIKDAPEALREFTREAMKDYAKAFHREIDGRPVNVDDIKYYAKIERHRSFKGHDLQIRENQSFATKILALKNEIRNIEQGRQTGNIKTLNKQINQLEQKAPHQLHGQRIVRGMEKPGFQSHIHIIVSRKDRSNRYSLSPGSKHRASEVELHGKSIKRGFDRNQFFNNAEKSFDRLFNYQRNFAEAYQSRKLLLKEPKSYFLSLQKLPFKEQKLAFSLLQKAGINAPKLHIPKNNLELTLKAIHQLKRGVKRAIEAGSIGI
ncbi:mobilization protein [Zunongwangia sp. SCSIO 43204]|uniref:MobB family relaxase n=1 Tax=Zunongwangia sp. SCSIO 43204 TaxID=2779359 RepID=UPI001CA8D180|nr:MobB family relaxase [Zunongwangia sp. SCSIO 43204]UAB84155.1 mobilization protein [Zunongwangia sp. SCSIO 43204]